MRMFMLLPWEARESMCFSNLAYSLMIRGICVPRSISFCSAEAYAVGQCWQFRTSRAVVVAFLTKPSE